MDILRIFTIRESHHRIHNPFTPDKLALLGQALRLQPDTSTLDLGCGSGEMLCTWARDHGLTGTGVDLSALFTEQARARAVELGVAEMVLADQDAWDRYTAAQWLTMRIWLDEHPDDEMADEVRDLLRTEPATYAAYTREYIGWGVFALRKR